MEFNKRSTASELMDNPDLDMSVLRTVYTDLERANKWLGGNKITLDAVAQILNTYPPGEITILDMGCGSGAMLRALARYGQSSGHKLKLIGIDLNEQALEIARERSHTYPQIRFLKQDILTLNEKDIHCDILLCTLTMHHFDSADIPIFLKKFSEIARIGVVINDLQRSKWAYYLFKLYSTIFIHSNIARHDGLISIRSAFRKNELLQLTSCLPMMKHTISWRWAFRYAWIMQKIDIQETG